MNSNKEGLVPVVLLNPDKKGTVILNSKTKIGQLVPVEVCENEPVHSIIDTNVDCSHNISKDVNPWEYSF